MSGPDRIEIEQDGRILRGAGTLRVFAGVAGQGGWRELPTVKGFVTFDAPATLRDLEGMDDAEVRVTLARGGLYKLKGAVTMKAAGGPKYDIHLDCYGGVSSM